MKRFNEYEADLEFTNLYTMPLEPIVGSEILETNIYKYDFQNEGCDITLKPVNKKDKSTNLLNKNKELCELTQKINYAINKRDLLKNERNIKNKSCDDINKENINDHSSQLHVLTTRKRSYSKNRLKSSKSNEKNGITENTTKKSCDLWEVHTPKETLSTTQILNEKIIRESKTGKFKMVLKRNRTQTTDKTTYKNPDNLNKYSGFKTPLKPETEPKKSKKIATNNKKNKKDNTVKKDNKNKESITKNLPTKQIDDAEVLHISTAPPNLIEHQKNYANMCQTYNDLVKKDITSKIKELIKNARKAKASTKPKTQRKRTVKSQPKVQKLETNTTTAHAEENVVIDQNSKPILTSIPEDFLTVTQYQIPIAREQKITYTLRPHWGFMKLVKDEDTTDLNVEEKSNLLDNGANSMQDFRILPGRFGCELCELHFLNCTEQKAHLNSHKINSLYECCLCKYRTLSWKTFVSHKFVHHFEYANIYKCRVCDTTFNNLRLFHRHIALHAQS